MLLGDFNNITCLHEKWGGNQSVSTHVTNFVNFLNNASLISLQAFGVPFTWTNKHKDDTLIFERSHRVVANSFWLELQPNYSLHNYPILDSDHSPLYLSLIHI